MSIYSVSSFTVIFPHRDRIAQEVRSKTMATMPSIARRARQMAPNERRQQLLDVAIHVFAEKGIDGARHGDVARAAGVSVPTVHAYFKTRNDLVSAVLQAVGRYIIDVTIVPFTNGSTLDERMLESGQNLIRTVPVNSDYFKIWVMWSAYFGDPIREEYLQFEEEVLASLCQLLTGNPAAEQDNEMRDKALVFLGLAVFLTQMILRGESVERQEHYIENVMQTVKIWI